ncbi:YheC/YheD family protein [Paenibacillus mesotrionivorans]|uniref:YheC/YheD family protein n=1 Tax=Paenibacillus mesotrionivorans TaxID=3160968 RepID=A0ACC7P6E5_9BACL
MPTPTLGVMTLYLDGGRIEELSYFRKLSHTADKIGLELFVFTPEDVTPDGKQLRAWVYNKELNKWERKLSDFPDIVYDRCRYQRNYRFPLLRKFRAEHPQLLYMSRPLVHKWSMHQNLSRNRRLKPYLPETAQYQNPSDILHMLDHHGLVYVKPIDGTGGRGILRIERLENGNLRVQGREKSRKIIAPFTVSRTQLGTRLGRWKLYPRYLVQQGIRIALKDGRIHDFRLLIQKDGTGQWKVTGSAGRIGARHSVTSNLHGGGSAVPTEKLLRARFGSAARVKTITGDMERLAFLTAEHLEKQFGSLCELALDIAIDERGKVWLLEINPKPAREVFARIGNKDIYQKAIERPLEYALYLYKRQNG